MIQDTDSAIPAPLLRTETRVAQLNDGCFCVTVDRPGLVAEIERRAGDLGYSLMASRPHLFAEVPAFVPRAHAEQMLATIAAIEAAARLPAYRDAALGQGVDIARHDHGPAGAFMGYDFHLGPDGPRLIEINTNAGGAALNALLLAAQRACCAEVAAQVEPAQGEEFEAAVVEMFRTEWRRQRGDAPLRTIAIVDDDPDSQFLYPEFVLFERMLERAGLLVVIADPAQLRLEGGRLMFHNIGIDLVYNRLVDFALAKDRHAALRQAYAEGAAVVTPNPHVHALLADKRNLVLLSDAERLATEELDPRHVAALRHVPRTLEVTPEGAPELWATRRQWFFKPVSGHGSKGVYRGDKLTRGVWDEISRGGYVAQAFAAPGERQVRVGGVAVPRKMDVRVYAYAGRPLLMAARLYQGQATNFRTEGGGFAAVFVV